MRVRSPREKQGENPPVRTGSRANPTAGGTPHCENGISIALLYVPDTMAAVARLAPVATVSARRSVVAHAEARPTW